jgi:hypothetical protein
MMTFDKALATFRRGYFLRAIELCGGNLSAAAEVTGVHRNTIGRELRAAGLDAPAAVKLCGLKRRVHRLNPGPGKKPPVAETAESIQRRFELARRLG